jgi:hypothetical protein
VHPPEDHGTNQESYCEGEPGHRGYGMTSQNTHDPDNRASTTRNKQQDPVETPRLHATSMAAS